MQNTFTSCFLSKEIDAFYLVITTILNVKEVNKRRLSPPLYSTFE
jgi:hypothetical protein